MLSYTKSEQKIHFIIEVDFLINNVAIIKESNLIQESYPIIHLGQ